MILIKRIKIINPIVRHYSIALILTLGTSAFGALLIHNMKNVIQRVELFPEGTSVALGITMIILAILKLCLVFKKDSNLKKYVLLAITMCWLTISWAYIVNQTQNTGSVMALMITAICYLELWRGDYSV